MHPEIQKTHFADDDTLAYISRLERERAELIEALKMAHGAIMETNSAKFTKTYDLVGALLSRLGAA
jgi:hypothetical protein